MSTIKADTISNVAGTASTSMLNAVNGSAKAWVNFNGTGTVAIRASYNVSSITDNGTGLYTVNFSSALSSSIYCVASSSTVGTTTSYASVTPFYSASTYMAPTSSSFVVNAHSPVTGTAEDGQTTMLTVFV
jgi:hypothetical protein